MEARLRPRRFVFISPTRHSRLATLSPFPGARRVCIHSHPDRQLTLFIPGLTVYALPLLSAFLDVSGQLLLVAAYAVCGMESISTASTAGDPDMSSVSDVADSAMETVIEVVRRRWFG